MVVKGSASNRNAGTSRSRRDFNSRMADASEHNQATLCFMFISDIIFFKAYQIKWVLFRDERQLQLSTLLDKTPTYNWAKIVNSLEAADK